ncbi:ankyrin [Hypoxylon sp. FL0890]|nr:ankyrin [Hypoxylon sp. FL0890]
MAKLDKLATELQQKIATCGILDIADLANLTRVSKKLRSTINPCLYNLFGNRHIIDWAVDHSRIETLELAAKFGPDIHYNLDDPLRRACRLGHEQIVTCLLNYDARMDPVIVNGSSEAKSSSLHIAINWGHEDIAMLLIERGAIPYFFSRLHQGSYSRLEFHTALHMAVELNLLRLTEFLIQEGFSADEEDERGNTPLWICCTKAGDPAMIKKLSDLGANVNKVQNHGELLLTVALSQGAYDQATALLKAGATAKPSDPHWGAQHPIHACIVSGFNIYPRWDHTIMCPMISRLLDAGADINGSTVRGRTPLGEAMFRRAPLKIMSHLLALGANPNGKDGKGMTPLDIFMGNGGVIEGREWRLEKAELLLQAGARIDIPLAAGQTLLEWALDNEVGYDSGDTMVRAMEVFLAMATPENLRRGYLDDLLEQSFKPQYYEKCKILIRHGATLSSDKALSAAKDLMDSFNENRYSKRDYCEGHNILLDMGLPIVLPMALPTEEVVAYSPTHSKRRDGVGMCLLRCPQST